MPKPETIVWGFPTDYLRDPPAYAYTSKTSFFPGDIPRPTKRRCSPVDERPVILPGIQEGMANECSALECYQNSDCNIMGDEDCLCVHGRRRGEQVEEIEATGLCRPARGRPAVRVIGRPHLPGSRSRPGSRGSLTRDSEPVAPRTRSRSPGRRRTSRGSPDEDINSARRELIRLLEKRDGVEPLEYICSCNTTYSSTGCCNIRPHEILWEAPGKQVSLPLGDDFLV